MEAKSTPHLLHELDFGSLSSRERRTLASLLLEMPERDEARGARIAALREDGGLKQPQVVRGLEEQEGAPVISLRGYQEWEAGGNLKPENLRALARFHGVDHRWIDKGEEHPRDVPGQPLTVADVERLKRIEELLEEIVKRLPAPTEQPAAPPSAPAEDPVPDRLPDDPDRPRDAPAEDEPGSAQAS